jgi:hypothetical protein
VFSMGQSITWSFSGHLECCPGGERGPANPGRELLFPRKEMALISNSQRVINRPINPKSGSGAVTMQLKHGMSPGVWVCTVS